MSMNQNFRLLMLSAMYENGGNMTHRFLDGHPQMYVYPFESQLGTRYVKDFLSSMYPLKYRWPSFLLDASPSLAADSVRLPRLPRKEKSGPECSANAVVVDSFHANKVQKL